MDIFAKIAARFGMKRPERFGEEFAIDFKEQPDFVLLERTKNLLFDRTFGSASLYEIRGEEEVKPGQFLVDVEDSEYAEIAKSILRVGFVIQRWRCYRIPSSFSHALCFLDERSAELQEREEAQAEADRKALQEANTPAD